MKRRFSLGRWMLWSAVSYMLVIAQTVPRDADTSGRRQPKWRFGCAKNVSRLSRVE